VPALARLEGGTTRCRRGPNLLHDAHRLTARIDEARVTKLIAEHDSLKRAI
jgi:hypothetical protein